MALRNIDLNLLVILDALLDEGQVTRAASRLGLSQPAASSALERCRHLFADPLLERGAGGMRLSPKAEALREPLKRLLAETQALIDPPAPDIAGIVQTVRVIMADLPAFGIAARLYSTLRHSAPGLQLVVMAWHGAEAALDAMAKGQADLAVSVFPAVENSFVCREILFEHYVVAMRQEHPAAAAFDLEQWLAYPHVLVSGRGEAKGALDETLARQGRSRRVGVVVPNFLMVRQLLLASDLIAMVPSKALVLEGQEGLAVFAPPLAVEGFGLHIAWHKRRDQDLAARHVAGLIEAELKAL